ncbi:MAG: Rrf2 family transcriptional regulator [Gammaproteobacteria bacterium]|nr:Rrf2 family transcriptional regulator [Gammaproteobacteria bacterium]
MRLSSKGRFAVTAMMDVAMRQKLGPVSLATISERQNISLSYLEQLFSKLRKKNLVYSVRGPGGGYELRKKARDITVAEIILSVDSPLDATQCSGRKDCLATKKSCMTHDLWSSLNEKVLSFLSSMTLQHLIDEHDAKTPKKESFESIMQKGSQPVIMALRGKLSRS